MNMMTFMLLALSEVSANWLGAECLMCALSNDSLWDNSRSLVCTTNRQNQASMGYTPLHPSAPNRPIFEWFHLLAQNILITFLNYNSISGMRKLFIRTLNMPWTALSWSVYSPCYQRKCLKSGMKNSMWFYIIFTFLLYFIPNSAQLTRTRKL